ncbi:exodeoxyribonuclease VII small subunit [bacterium SCSIO 12696]|nr:exodeoxyribonuclease VII small subunit [bacterium SCSIO 12696]
MASSKSSSKQKSINFEQKLSELEALVNHMESGDMSLEESLKAFEKGIQITRQCQQALSDAEQKVSILTQNNQGELDEKPFEPGSSDT